MMEEKGVWTLVDACQLLKQHSYHFECHFVGKWSDNGRHISYLPCSERFGGYGVCSWC